MRLLILIIHICGGVAGLLSGIAAASFRKGAPRHRMAGNIFFVAMLTNAQRRVLAFLGGPKIMLLAALPRLLMIFWLIRIRFKNVYAQKLVLLNGGAS